MSTLHHWQNQRITWFVMFASTLFLELCALYFQYIMKLDPCERCVYQRLAILVLMVNSVIMWVKPTHWGVRIAGYSLWLVGAVYGLKEAIAQLADYGSFNPFSSSCSLKPTFPFDLPLYDWWPSLFMPTGLCGADNWSFLSLNMAQWMVGIFSVYLLALAVCIISSIYGAFLKPLERLKVSPS